jgi:hypothetical protein
MRKARIGAAALAACAGIATGLLPATAGAIVDGSFDGDGHPYVGAAVSGDYFCSGSLVTPTVFVTAGHCTAGFAQSGEATFVTFDAQARPTSEYVTGTPYTHPDFFDVPPQGLGLPHSLGSDVGVVVLDEPVDLPRYAALPSLGALDTMPSAPLSLVGYGADGWHLGESAVPDLHVRPHDRLKPPDQPRRRLGPQLHQPGRDNGGIGPNDSGSPALPIGTDVVTAITSHVTNPRGSGNAYWYRLDTANAR